tara:strand:- start:4436 stop:5728 length:1293 start_codon:yes stop_codon:yes gene_type:complete
MKPVYILIAILLAVDNVFIRFRIGGLSYDRLLEFILFFVFFKVYLSETIENPFFKKWNRFIILFALLQLVINFNLAIWGKIDFEVVYTDFVKCFSFLVYSFLFLLLVKKDIKYINIILFVHFLICIFAFLQHPLSPIASQMMEIKKMLYSTGNAEDILSKLGLEETYVEGGFANRFRLSGPFNSSISFSYFAISSFILNLYMYLRFKKKIYIFFLGTLFIASVLSQTRSLLLAEICLVFGYMFFAPSKRQSIIKLVMVAGALAAIIFVYVGQDMLSTGESRITKISSKGDNRPLLWLTGIYTVIKHPFGITEQEYVEARKEMFVAFGDRGILQLAAHNGLINVGFHYSIFGYVLFFFFVLFLLRQINELEPKYVIFFRLTLFAYLIQASFHNNFILSSDYPYLMILILIWADWDKNSLKGENKEIQLASN